jgi:type IV pilus assembly protein PilW
MSARSIQQFSYVRSRHSHYEAGLTLVEIMIALTLGLLVLLAIGSVYIGSRQTYRVQEDNARIQEAGRYALEVIGRSIRQAGADSEMNYALNSQVTSCSPPTCTPIIGVNNASPTPDSFTVQFYAGREEDTGAGWVTRNCTGGNVNAIPPAIVTNAFTVSGTDLRCSGNAVVPQPLIADVEDMQVIYGVDSSGTDDSVDIYTASPANWALVYTARVCVQLRSAANGLVTTPQTYLNCAGALGTSVGPTAFTTAPAGDLRIHRSFVTTYGFRNRINVAP